MVVYFISETDPIKCLNYKRGCHKNLDEKSYIRLNSVQLDKKSLLGIIENN